MRRVLTARQQAEMLAAWTQPRLAALPPDVPRLHWRASDETGGEFVPRLHWRASDETGGEFDSKIRPASHVDVPHPRDVYGPEGYARWVAKRGGEPKDPINDPWGRLDDHHNTFEQMVQNKVDHYLAQTKAEALNGRVWYRAFHDGTKAVAEKARKLKNWGDDTHARVVSLFSAFSPKTPWHRNVEFASNFVDKYDGDPAKRHDWKAANIHPMALRQYRKQYGGVPTDSPEDLHRLADLHAPFRGFGEIQTPEGRQEWMDNIAARGGIGAALDRHTDEVIKAHKNTAKKSVLMVRGRPIAATDAYGRILKNRNGNLKSKYIPTEAFTHTHPSTPTLGSNIGDAKKIHDAEGDEWKTVLGGRKTQSFSINGADESELREPRPGVAEDHGYYHLPLGEDGRPDWTKHPDQEVTADTHDVRAIDTPADAGPEFFRDLEYKTPAWFSGSVRGQTAKVKGPDGREHDLGYDLAHRVNWAATKRINEMQADEMKHVIPKQTQAGVWGRFKNMVTRYSGKAPADGASWWFSLPGYGELAQHFRTLQSPGAAEGVTARRRTAALMDGIGHTWAEWLGNWVERYFAARGEDPDEQYPHRPEQAPPYSPSDQMQREVEASRRTLAWVDRLLAAAPGDDEEGRHWQTLEQTGNIGDLHDWWLRQNGRNRGSMKGADDFLEYLREERWMRSGDDEYDHDRHGETQEEADEVFERRMEGDWGGPYDDDYETDPDGDDELRNQSLDMGQGLAWMIKHQNDVGSLPGIDDLPAYSDPDDDPGPDDPRIRGAHRR